MNLISLPTTAWTDLATAATANLTVHFTWVQSQHPSMQVIADDDLVITDCGLPCDTFNAMCRANLSPHTAPNQVQFALDYFVRVSRPFSWWLSPSDQPNHLADLLVEAGLQLAETELAMAVDLERLQPADLTPHSLRIDRVQTTAQLQDFARVVAANWTPADEQVLRFYELAAPLVLNDNSSLWYYVGYVGDAPVTSCELTVGGGVVGLYSVCTLAAYRQRGFGTALTLQPLLDARQQGYRTAILQASEGGARIYKRLGFEVFGQISEFKPTL